MLTDVAMVHPFFMFFLKNSPWLGSSRRCYWSNDPWRKGTCSSGLLDICCAAAPCRSSNTISLLSQFDYFSVWNRAELFLAICSVTFGLMDHFSLRWDVKGKKQFDIFQWKITFKFCPVVQKFERNNGRMPAARTQVSAAWNHFGVKKMIDRSIIGCSANLPTFDDLEKKNSA